MISKINNIFLDFNSILNTCIYMVNLPNPELTVTFLFTTEYLWHCPMISIFCITIRRIMSSETYCNVRL